MSTAKAWNSARALAIIEPLASLPGALLPILHALQDEFAYIDSAAVPLIAKALNLSKAEVHGVISFYHDFRQAPPGRHVLKICRAEACQSMGCDALIGHVEGKLKTKLGETAADGSFTIEPVYCLGNCACSPAMQIGEEIYGRVSAKSFDETINTVEELA